MSYGGRRISGSGRRRSADKAAVFVNPQANLDLPLAIDWPPAEPLTMRTVGVSTDPDKPSSAVLAILRFPPLSSAITAAGPITKRGRPPGSYLPPVNLPIEI